MAGRRQPVSYVTFWSQGHVRLLNEHGDAGPLRVIYGGPHTRMPSIKRVRARDVLYPVALEQGRLMVMGRMTVAEVIPAQTFSERELGLDPACRIALPSMPFPAPEAAAAFQALWEAHPHWLPQTCCAALASVAEEGSAIRPRPFPMEQIDRLLLGRPGRERPPRRKDGRVLCVSLSGSVRRLSPESAALFETLFAGEAYGDP